jgi:hypothetical protein
MVQAGEQRLQGWVQGEPRRLLFGVDDFNYREKKAIRPVFVFLATEDLHFSRKSLAHNIENDYLPLYLYTLYQKLQLLVFSADFMSEVAEVGYDLGAVRALMERFVHYRNKYIPV